MTDTNQIELRKMVEEIDTKGEGLTDWELRFIADLTDNSSGFYSAAQATVIERIWKHRMP
jgi:hypothetical protein